MPSGGHAFRARTGVPPSSPRHTAAPLNPPPTRDHVSPAATLPYRPTTASRVASLSMGESEFPMIGWEGGIIARGSRYSRKLVFTNRLRSAGDARGDQTKSGTLGTLDPARTCDLTPTPLSRGVRRRLHGDGGGLAGGLHQRLRVDAE